MKTSTRLSGGGGGGGGGTPQTHLTDHPKLKGSRHRPVPARSHPMQF